MARYRRKEQSFESWFLGFVFICAVTFGAYKYMTQVVIDMGQGIVDRSVEQQRKQQQAIAEQREQEVRRQALAARELEATRQAAFRKAAAWDAYFKPSKKCAADPITVECGNEYMRAKGRFEESYADAQ